MRQHNIEINWRVRGIRTPKVLKGHDDHVITCLQFSNNRIVSGSDDNTLKVSTALKKAITVPTPLTLLVTSWGGHHPLVITFGSHFNGDGASWL